MRRNFLFIFCFLLFLTGCLSNSGHKVYLSNTKSFNLIQPGYYSWDDIEELYSFEIKFNDTKFSCISLLNISSEELYLNIFNEIGLSMGEIFFDGDNLDFESSFLPENLRAEYIVLDIQNVFFSKEILKNHYGKKGINIIETYIDEITTRKIYERNKVIETITYNADSICLQNSLRGYEFILNKVEN